jgi:hypothetical protein
MIYNFSSWYSVKDDLFQSYESESNIISVGCIHLSWDLIHSLTSRSANHFSASFGIDNQMVIVQENTGLLQYALTQNA